MKKICPKCSSEFICRADSIELCSCHNVKLNVGVRDYIKTNYGECLCPKCLDEANTSFHSPAINSKYTKQKQK